MSVLLSVLLSVFLSVLLSVIALRRSGWAFGAKILGLRTWRYQLWRWFVGAGVGGGGREMGGRNRKRFRRPEESRRKSPSGGDSG